MEEYDDCYCPAGVVERQERNVRISGVVLTVVAALVLKGLLSLVSKLWNSLITGASEFVHYVSIHVAVILGVMVGVIGLIWMGFDLFHWKAFGRVPRWIKPFKWIVQKIRRFFYMKDLRKRFRERPELSDVTLPEVLLEMYDHHDQKEIPTPAQRLAYVQIYEKAKLKEFDYVREQRRIVSDFAERILDN